MMTLRRYCILAFAGMLLLCAYPVYMGAGVIVRMARCGCVPMEDYPKYVIPYAPIALALIVCTALMPLFLRIFGKHALIPGAALSLALFFISERLMETRITVLATKAEVSLESWQMSMCYVPPDLYETRPWKAVDVLLGGYSPAFKLHFYLISAVVILSLLRGVYGFGAALLSGDRSRRPVLVIQSVCGAVFLLMCVWACLTAFYRTGELTVPRRSGVLMAVYFTLLGVTAGMFAGSFTFGRRRLLSIAVPAFIASMTVALMYAGEMALLNGHLYQLGSGWFFRGLGRLVLSPADICVVIASGAVTAALCVLARRRADKLDASGRQAEC